MEPSYSRPPLIITNTKPTLKWVICQQRTSQAFWKWHLRIGLSHIYSMLRCHGLLTSCVKLHQQPAAHLSCLNMATHLAARCWGLLGLNISNVPINVHTTHQNMKGLHDIRIENISWPTKLHRECSKVMSPEHASNPNKYQDYQMVDRAKLSGLFNIHTSYALGL